MPAVRFDAKSKWPQKSAATKSKGREPKEDDEDEIFIPRVIHENEIVIPRVIRATGILEKFERQKLASHTDAKKIKEDNEQIIREMLAIEVSNGIPHDDLCSY